MSDTLQERKSFHIGKEHCNECFGYPHAPWCSLYKEPIIMTEKQRTEYPKGSRIEAIREIGCHVGSIPTGTRGTVSDHTYDGRAWIYFDGFDAGHTFQEPEKFIRVVCNHQDQTCPANTSEHQPAARGGGEEWRVAQRYDGVVLIVRAESDNRETPLLTLSKSDDDYVMANRIVTEHNQHQSLMAERERLVLTIKNALDKVFNDGKQPDGWVQIQQSAIDELRALVESIE